MISIKNTELADSRTATKIPSAKEVFEASQEHIEDVKRCMYFFERVIKDRAFQHDYTKLKFFDSFYKSYLKSMTEDDYEFKQDDWYFIHKTWERHHIKDKCPEDVNLIDVLERICDIVAAAKGRAGNEAIIIDMVDGELLQKAYKNTIDLLENEIIVIPDDNYHLPEPDVPSCD